MRVNDLAVGRDDIARPAGDLARRRAVDRYLLADIDIIARNDARPRAGDRELSRAFLRREFGERLDRIRRHADPRRPLAGEIVDPIGNGMPYRLAASRAQIGRESFRERVGPEV